MYPFGALFANQPCIHRPGGGLAEGCWIYIYLYIHIYIYIYRERERGRERERESIYISPGNSWQFDFVGVGGCWLHVGSMLAHVGSMLAHVGPSGLQDGSRCHYVGSGWPQDGQHGLQQQILINF